MEDIVIKPVIEEDLHKIVSLRKIFSSSDDPVRHLNDISYYSWHNFNNPIGRGSFWAAYYGEKAVGMFSMIPKQISIHSHKYLICEVCDAFTHPNFQGRKIWSRLFKLNYEDIIGKDIHLLYASSPTSASYPIFINKFNFIQLKDVKLIQLIRPLNFQSIIKLKSASHMLSKTLSFLLNPPYNLIFKSTNKKVNALDINIKREMRIPSQYQEFWSKCEDLFDLYFVRDLEYIQWRYFSAPEHYEFYTLNNDNSMVGYYVLKIIPWRDLTIGAVVDYFSNSNNVLVFKSMINKVISSCMRRNIDFIQTWSLSSSPYYKQLVKCGFFPFRKETVIFLNHPIFNRLKNRKIKSHYTMSDSDYI